MVLNGGATSILYTYIRRYRSLLFVSIIICVPFLWSLESVVDDTFSIAFLDVGQGDSIFIETPRGVQVLVDAGSGAQVLRQLHRVMPFYDRSIDIVIATHPDKDHIGGLPDVFKRFEVGTYIESSVEDDGGIYHSLQESVKYEGSRHIVVNSPLSFVVDGVRFDILFPDRVATEIEKNTASLVMQVTYGHHSFLLTGDIPKSIERYLVAKYGTKLQSDVLKVGHHGSKTSSDALFVQTVAPTYAVISAGDSNWYGHPHAEVIDTLDSFHINISETKKGTILFLSDGASLTKRQD